MKTLIIDSLDSQTPGELFPQMRMVPGSAMVYTAKLLFVPDCAQTWLLRPLLGVHLCRLGKSIQPEFAHRYFDRFTLLLHLEPAHWPSDNQALADLLDDTLWLGPTVAVAPQVSIAVGADAATLSLEQLNIAHAIASVSKYCTIMMGDLLALPLPLSPLPVSEGMNIDVSLLDNTNTLRIR